MPPIMWNQDNEFNLQPISQNGSNINGVYRLLPSGKWQWTVTASGRAPMMNAIPFGGLVDTPAEALNLANTAVSAAFLMASALPALP